MAQQKFILQLQNVVKRFGGITASNDITINVPEGSIYGIIGPNGAGKTTLFNMITGVYDCTEGTVLFEGEKINGLPTHEIAVRGIARTFQNIRLFGDLTVYDNLLTACQKNITYSLLDGILRTKKCQAQERESRAFCDQLLAEVGLSDQRDQKANNLPYGMQRRLEIARALATCPKVILLDEPAAGMNEEESAKLSEFIRDPGQEGCDRGDHRPPHGRDHGDLRPDFRAQFRHPLSGGGRRRSEQSGRDFRVFGGG